MATVDSIAAGIDLLHDFIAHSRRDRRMPLSAQIRAAAKRGDPYARRVLASGILNDRPSPARSAPKRKPVAPPPPPPPKTKKQLERESISARVHRRFHGDFIAYQPRHDGPREAGRS